MKKIFSIISLSSGIFSLSIGLLAFLLDRVSDIVDRWFKLGIFQYTFIPIAIVGIISGIIGQKSAQKKIAYIGIVLSIFGLIILLFWYFILFGFSHMQ